jgi:predicted nucleic acid-binding Zn ribbon protein
MADSVYSNPRALSTILAELFTRKGYSRIRIAREVESIWNEAVGEPGCWQTQVGEVRHGVLDVTVAHPTLLEELKAFQKPALLSALRKHTSLMAIRDIRFRVGRVHHEDAEQGPQ